MAFITQLLVVLSLSVGGLYILRSRFGTQVDPREPPFVKPRVPLIGHALGLLRHGSNYWVQVDSKVHLPIFTAGVLRKKFYVVTSLDLVNSVHRNAKTLSFAPFVTMTAEKLSCLRPKHVSLFKKYDGREGLANDTILAVENSLHQADVDNLNVPMLDCLKNIIDKASSGRDYKLHAWVRHLVTQGSTRALYGPQNPFNTQAVEDAFWTFEQNASILMNGFLPQVAGRKGLNARNIVAQAFLEYYRHGEQEQASAVAYSKWKAPTDYGLGDEEIAQIEVPFLIGVLNNTTPTAFWALCHIFSDQTLLAALRTELVGAVETVVRHSVPAPKHILDISLLKRRCPLLLSVYHETLRRRTSFSASRFVTDDTHISDSTGRSYLLKAGAVLQISADVIHADVRHWGSDASTTDFHRFVDPARKKKHPLAFRSFGGAPYICPGRQFATTEIMAMLAMLVLRYEVVPVGGKWEIPKQKLTMFGSVPPPDGDVDVVFKQREGWHGEWEFRVGTKGLPWVLESG